MKGTISRHFPRIRILPWLLKLLRKGILKWTQKDAWRPLHETLREKPQNRNCKYLQFLGWGRGTKKERFMSFKLGFRKLGRFSNGFEQQFAWGEGVSLRQRMRMSRVSGKECLLSIASVFKKIEEKSTNYDFWDKSQRSIQL